MSNEGHSAAGRSIIEMLWEQADIKYADLMRLIEIEEAWPKGEIVEALSEGRVEGAVKTAEEIVKALELRGALQGLAYALYKMLHTYEPTKVGMDKIRAELKARWEASEEEE